MENLPLISIIVPVYNAEKHLSVSCGCIIAQTYPNLEILFIDDGSTDSSPEILKEYEGSDNRVRVVRQENRGAGAARNLGLDMAQGEYLSFLDADDFFEPEMVSKAYEKARMHDADICIFRYDRVDDSNNRFGNLGYISRLVPGKLCFGAEDIKEDLFKLTNPMAWNKLYRRSFILEKKVRFFEIATANDLNFTYKSLMIAKRIVVFDEILLHYRRGSGMTMGRSKSGDWRGLYDALLLLKEDAAESGHARDKDVFNFAVQRLLLFMNRIQDTDVLHSCIKDLRCHWSDTLLAGHDDGSSYYDHRDFDRMQALMGGDAEDYLLSEKKHLRNRFDELQTQYSQKSEELRALQSKYGEIFSEYSEISSLKRHIKRFVRKKLNLPDSTCTAEKSHEIFEQ